MKNAYLIQCHKDPELINNLVNQLSDSDTDIYIHVDKRSNIVENLTRATNIFIIDNRFDVNWGSFKQVLATLEMLKMAVNKNYNYITLLSGQDYPIHSNEVYYKYLKESRDSEFIEFFNLPYEEWSYEGGIGRIKYYWIDYLTPKRNYIARVLRNVHLYTFGRLFSKDISKLNNLYGGSQWFSITGKLGNYIVDFLKSNPDYLKVYKNSGCADEIFFQTLIMNSPFKNKVVNNNLRFIKWENGVSSPKLLTFSDINDIKVSGKFFMRKVDSVASSELLKEFQKY